MYHLTWTRGRKSHMIMKIHAEKKGVWQDLTSFNDEIIQKLELEKENPQHIKDWHERYIINLVLNFEKLKALPLNMGFPNSSVAKESACNIGDQGSIPELEKSPGEGNANPSQYSCLENSKKSQTRLCN